METKLYQNAIKSQRILIGKAMQKPVVLFKFQKITYRLEFDAYQQCWHVFLAETSEKVVSFCTLRASFAKKSLIEWLSN